MMIACILNSDYKCGTPEPESVVFWATPGTLTRVPISHTGGRWISRQGFAHPIPHKFCKIASVRELKGKLSEVNTKKSILLIC